MALSVNLNDLQNPTSTLQTQVEQNTAPPVQSAPVSKLKPPPAPSGPQPVVPIWERGFALDKAIQNAYLRAQNHMNGLLAHEGLQVQVESHETHGHVGVVSEQATGRVLKTTAGEEMLKLYAHNVRPKGIIVDGAL